MVWCHSVFPASLGTQRWCCTFRKLACISVHTREVLFNLFLDHILFQIRRSLLATPSSGIFKRFSLIFSRLVLGLGLICGPLGRSSESPYQHWGKLLHLLFSSPAPIPLFSTIEFPILCQKHVCLSHSLLKPYLKF